MTQTSSLKILPRKYRIVLPIALAVFLLAVSPIFFGSAYAQSVTPVQKLTSLSYSNNFPQSGAKLSAAAAKSCPSSAQCVYVADSIGGVQVFEGKSLLASIPIPLTASDPESCPVSAYYAYAKIFVTDPCGNFGAGEIRVLNPATNKWGAPIISAGGEPTFMVLNPKNNFLYVTNFDYGTVTVINSKGTVEGVVSTCGQLPEFLDYDSESGLVFVGNRENFTTGAGCVDMINGLTAETPITHSYPVIDLLSVTGVTVNQATGNVYINDALQNNGQGVVYEYSAAGNFIRGIAPSTGSYEIWGSVYNPSTNSVVVVSPETFLNGLFNETGFVFSISSSNVVSAPAYTGLVPQAGCYNPADKSVYVPNFLNVIGSAVSVVKGAQVSNIAYVGETEGFGCAVN